MLCRILLLSFVVLSFAFPAEAQWVKRERINSHVTMSFGDCASCDFTGRDLSGLKIKKSNLTGALFNRANLSGGEIYGSNMSGAHFKRAFLARVKGDNLILQGANMNGAILTESYIRDTSFSGATLTGVDFARGHFIASNFNGANMQNISALAADFSGSHFVGSKFDDANLTGALLNEADLRDTEFGTSRMHGASLAGAKLHRANLAHVKGLRQAQLNQACGDADTTVPANLSIPFCLDNDDVNSSDSHGYSALAKRDKAITERMELAITRTQNLMEKTDSHIQEELQKIYRDLMAVQRQIED